MKHIKSPGKFLHESEESEGDSKLKELTYLKKLRRSGLITDREYYENVLSLGLPHSEVFEPGEMFVKWEDSAGEFIPEEAVREILANWQGPGGERVVFAEGEITDQEGSYKLKLILSTGMAIDYEYGSYFHMLVRVVVDGHELDSGPIDEMVDDAMYDVEDEWWENLIPATINSILEFASSSNLP